MMMLLRVLNSISHHAVRCMIAFGSAIICFSAFAIADEQAQWIWNHGQAATSAPVEQVFFRKTIEVPADVSSVQSALIEITADNGYVLHVNGRRVGAGTEWATPGKFQVHSLLQPGKNVIAVLAENASASPAGLAAEVSLQMKDGTTLSASSGKSWLWNKAYKVGWQTVEFDDSGWEQSAELGPYPQTAPWGGAVNRTNLAVVTPSVGKQQSRSISPETGIFRNGDCVVLLGSTNIERMQADGYFETLVTTALPNLKLMFRNLGWSGDDVWGTARAVFGSQADGFARLERDLFEVKPTLILVSYGTSESFAGEAGLSRFLAGLSTLVDSLEQTGAAIAFVSPTAFEKLGAPLPDPKSQNENLKVYCDAIRAFAAERNCSFIDMFQPLGPGGLDKNGFPTIRDRLTNEGMHFNRYGHWRIAPHLMAKLGVRPSDWQLRVDLTSQSYSAEGMQVSALEFQTEGLTFTAKDDHLPYAAPPAFSPRGGDMAAPHDRIVIKGLPEGNYGLSIDERPTLRANEKQWEVGVLINRSLYLDQVDELREVIRKKNEFYFHRYRPQNETYLFLFRKHEQGNNAVEIPQFDPIIAQQESEIERLKQPLPHTYRLKRVEVASN
jgi:lysophospholipase L1-like esterase